MRLIKQTDNEGYKHLTWIKDNDPDTAQGIHADPPNIQELDWQAILMEIHNGLVDHNLIQFNDIRRSNSGLDNIILRAIKRRIVNLYRSVENE